MTEDLPADSEFEWLNKIVEESKRKAEPKVPSITQVLKVYDEFISKEIFIIFSIIIRRKENSFWISTCSNYLQKNIACCP